MRAPLARLLLPLVCPVFAVLSVLAATGCADSSCIEGRKVACACDNGEMGTQTCSKYGDFETCSCDDDGSSSSSPSNHAGSGSTPIPFRDSGRPAINIDASLASVDASLRAPDAGLPISRSAAFIAIFADADSFWLVDADGVTRLSLLAGNELARWSAPRALLSAAFDGTQLVALDGAKLTTLHPSDLSVSADGTLTEACTAAVLLSANRVVCAPTSDYNRVYYTYDSTTGKLLASSLMYSNNGVAMRALPGLDAFVATSNTSYASPYNLYSVGSDNTAVFVGTSPYDSNVSSSGVFGFDGSPPVHLVQNQGLMLRISTECPVAMNSGVASCFAKDGALGTLTGMQTFAAIDSSGPTFTGLVDPRTSSYSPFDSNMPTTGYLLQTIDLPSRTKLTEQTVSVPFGQNPLALRALLEQKRALLVLSKAPTTQYSSAPATGYDILRIELK